MLDFVLEVVVVVVVGTFTRGVKIIDISGDKSLDFLDNLDNDLRSRLFKKLFPSSSDEVLREEEIEIV